MTITAYLIFNGQAEAAIGFYKEIFGGDIEMLSRFGEVPGSAQDDSKDLIMHARLLFDGNTIMFSDAMPNSNVTRGTGTWLAIGIEQDEDKAKLVFDKLAVDGNVSMPLEKQFWGALYGQLTDQFGVQWMINCNL